MMRRTVRWFDRQIKDRPFFSALVVLIFVVVPGYARLETAVSTANDSAETANEAAESAEKTSESTAKIAEQLVRITELETERDKRVTLANCQTRNTSSARGRERFETFFTVFETVVNNDPDQTEENRQRAADFFSDLRSQVTLDPSTEDVDCDGDGILTSEDYAA